MAEIQTVELKEKWAVQPNYLCVHEGSINNQLMCRVKTLINHSFSAETGTSPDD